MNTEYWNIVNIIKVNQQFKTFHDFDTKFSLIKETFNLEYATASSRFIKTDTKVKARNIEFNPDLKYSELTLVCKGTDAETNSQTCPSKVKLSAARGKYQTLVCSEYCMDHNHTLEYLQPDPDVRKKETEITHVLNELGVLLHSASDNEYNSAMNITKNDILKIQNDSFQGESQARALVECTLDNSTNVDQQEAEGVMAVMKVKSNKNSAFIFEENNANDFEAVEKAEVDGASAPGKAKPEKKKSKKTQAISETSSVDVHKDKGDISESSANDVETVEEAEVDGASASGKVKPKKKKGKQAEAISETSSVDVDRLIIEGEKKREVEPIAFSSLDAFHQLRKILKMLKVGKGDRKAVCTEKFEYVLKDTDFKSVPVESISFPDEGYNLLLERCTDKAKAFITNSIKEWNAKWQCSACGKKKSKSNKSIMCDACLLWFHVECITENFDEDKAWFCASCI